MLFQKLNFAEGSFHSLKQEFKLNSHNESELRHTSVEPLYAMYCIRFWGTKMVNSQSFDENRWSH